MPPKRRAAQPPTQNANDDTLHIGLAELEDTKRSALPSEIIIRVAEELDRGSLFRLRTVSKLFLFAARSRFKCEVVLTELPVTPRIKLLSKILNDPASAARIRKFEAMSSWSEKEINLVVGIIPLLSNLKHLALQTSEKPHPLEPLLFHATFERLTSLHLSTSVTSFPKTFIEKTTFPGLEDLSLLIRGAKPGESIQLTDAELAAFVNKYADRLISISIDYEDAERRDVSVLIGSFEVLPKIRSFKISGRWILTGYDSPLDILLEKNPMHCLKEIALAGFLDQRREWTIRLLRSIPPNIPPCLTTLKIGIRFDITTQASTWIRSLLPQLRTLWLSCMILEDETFRELFDIDVNSSVDTGVKGRIPVYGTLRSLLLHMPFPTTSTVNAFSKRFPSVHTMILIAEVEIQGRLERFSANPPPWTNPEKLDRKSWPLRGFSIVLSKHDSYERLKSGLEGTELVVVRENKCECSDCRDEGWEVGYIEPPGTRTYD